MKKDIESENRWLLRYTRKSFGLPRSHSLARNDENMLDSAIFAFFGGFESWGLRGILRLAKAKRSKNFALGASHGFKLTRFCEFAESSEKTLSF